jgi:hypothetical protein
MGASGTDVQLSAAALSRFPYDVECKNRAAFAIYSDFEQSSGRAGSQSSSSSVPSVPLLVIKANHKQPLAVVSLEHFMQLLKELNESKKSN